MSIYLISAINPPVSVINQLHSIFAKFYWVNTTNSKNKHWVSWDKMYLPKKERGLSFRSIQNVLKAFVDFQVEDIPIKCEEVLLKMCCYRI